MSAWIARLARHLKRVVARRPDRRSEVYLAIAEMLHRAERPDGEPPASPDLTPYELKVFSQNGEDGVLAEILRRVGTDTQTFVEFGTEAGVEATCTYLADVARWRGHFIEAAADAFEQLAAKYQTNDRVSATNAFVTPGNVEDLFHGSRSPSRSTCWRSTSTATTTGSGRR